MSAAQLPRNAQLARIHVCKAQLKMDDADYRALLRRIGNVESAADLGSAGRAAVIREMDRLGAPASGKRYADRKAPRARVLDRSAYLQKINAMLTDAQQPWEYAHAIAKRMFGVDRIEFVNAANLRKIVAAMAIQQRRGKRTTKGKDNG